MKRHALPPRPDWREKAESIGFTFHTLDDTPYWDESVAWSFTLAEVEEHIEASAAALETLCLAFVDRALKDERVMERLGVAPALRAVARESWSRRDRNLYGRFDLAYDGSGPPKLLEYNADTPTSLLEASVFQWMWLEDQMALGVLPAGSDQFNSLHERLVSALKALRFGKPYRLHVACAEDSEEDKATVDYIADCARQAGLGTRFLYAHEIGLSGDGRFVDLDNVPIEVLFKLYPWEWMAQEGFAGALAGAQTVFIEPAWKALLSTKAILPYLWEMAPGHPNLLPAYFADDPTAERLGGDYVEKPIHSREGANITVVQGGRVALRNDGPYEGPAIRQALAELARFSGGHAVVGAWVVASQPAGIGIREDAGLVTRDTARFVPHWIEAP